MKARLAHWFAPGRDDATLRERCLMPEALVGVLPAADWRWTLGEAELSGQTGEWHAYLMDREEDGAAISTEQLLTALSDGYGIQLTWGDLKGFEPGAAEPVITISGFDGTWYDIDGRDDLVAIVDDLFASSRWSDEHVQRMRAPVPDENNGEAEA